LQLQLVTIDPIAHQAAIAVAHQMLLCSWTHMSIASHSIAYREEDHMCQWYDIWILLSQAKWISPSLHSICSCSQLKIRSRCTYLIIFDLIPATEVLTNRGCYKFFINSCKGKVDRKDNTDKIGWQRCRNLQ
jgi:hypothetical protein